MHIDVFKDFVEKLQLSKIGILWQTVHTIGFLASISHITEGSYLITRQHAVTRLDFSVPHSKPITQYPYPNTSPESRRNPECSAITLTYPQILTLTSN